MTDYNNVAGNYYDKFGSKNPVVRAMMNGFKSTLLGLLQEIEYQSMLEIGCGEGHIQALLTPHHAIAFDIDWQIVRDAQSRFPQSAYFVGDGMQIALPSHSFDVTLAIEVLEHIPQPEKIIREAQRLTRRYAIFSVPNEPLWRILNMARGRYLTDWGNTPGHIQHWSKQQFVDTLSPYFEILTVRSPIPWTFVLCRLKP